MYTDSLPVVKIIDGCAPYDGRPCYCIICIQVNSASD